MAGLWIYSLHFTHGMLCDGLWLGRNHPSNSDHPNFSPESGVQNYLFVEQHSCVRNPPFSHFLFVGFCSLIYWKPPFPLSPQDTPFPLPRQGTLAFGALELTWSWYQTDWVTYSSPLIPFSTPLAFPFWSPLFGSWGHQDEGRQPVQSTRPGSLEGGNQTRAAKQV